VLKRETLERDKEKRGEGRRRTGKKNRRRNRKEMTSFKIS
jgi:hypothetical protein